MVAAAALNGIAVVRAYLLIFTGARHISSVSLGIGDRERFAVLTFSALILVAGSSPAARRDHQGHRAAAAILAGRERPARLTPRPPAGAAHRPIEAAGRRISRTGGSAATPRISDIQRGSRRPELTSRIPLSLDSLAIGSTPRQRVPASRRPSVTPISQSPYIERSRNARSCSQSDFLLAFLGRPQRSSA